MNLSSEKKMKNVIEAFEDIDMEILNLTAVSFNAVLGQWQRK